MDITRIAEVIADYTLQPNDNLLICNPTSLVTVTLPTGYQRGRSVVIKNRSATAYVKVSGTLDNTTYEYLGHESSAHFIFDGVRWNITSRKEDDEGFSFVDGVYDFPEPVNGIITLEDERTYYITTHVDITPYRIVAGENTTILGSSSENCSLTSTLESGQALISSNFSIPIRHITLSVSGSGAKILNLDATDYPTGAIDWYGVNFGGGIIGTIKNYSNAIFVSSAILSAVDGFTFEGSIGTISFDTTLFSGMQSGGTYITIPADAVITRRFRIVYSSLSVPSGATGINVNSSATIPVESYILDTVNFSNTGTYLTGVSYTDNKALFVNNKGINNSAAIAQMYMNGNAVATTIANTTDYVKIAGTTSANAINQKFSHSNGTLTYIGALTRNFKVSVVLSAIAGTNHLVYVRIAKDGATAVSSQQSSTTNASSRAEGIVSQDIVTLSTNNFLEVFVRNSTSSTNITVEDFNVTVEEI